MKQYIDSEAPNQPEMILVPQEEEKDGLGAFGGRKFIIGMTLILVSSIFTGIGIMTVDQWLMFTGVVGASYFGINFIQKKAL